jgi:hypothetical protein
LSCSDASNPRCKTLQLPWRHKYAIFALEHPSAAGICCRMGCELSVRPHLSCLTTVPASPCCGTTSQHLHGLW